MSFLGLRYAGSPVIRDLRWEHTTQSLTLSLDSVSNDAQAWDMEIPLEADAMGSKRAGAKLQAHRAQYARSAFTILMPQHLGTYAPATPVSVASAGSPADTSILLKSADGAASTLSEGRFFTIGDDTKVYIALEDVTIPAVGTVRLAIRPPLYAAAAVNAELNFSPHVRVKYSPNAPAQVGYTGGIVVSEVLFVQEDV